MRSPSTIRRATAIISPKLRSAVASVVRGAVTVTGMRRSVAASTSMFDGEIDCAAIIRKSGLAMTTSRSMRSWSRQNRISALRTASISVRLGMMRLASGKTLTLPTLRSRAIARADTGWVTKMRGRGVFERIRRATARFRRRHRRRLGLRRECAAWRRAHQAPSGCRVRERARRGARSNRRVRRRRRRHAAGCG